jgi:hypothetical protein
VFLLHTNVVSELRKTNPHGAVVRWLQSVDERDIYLSAVTIGELQAGVELTRPDDPGKAVEIEAWVEQLADSSQVLPMDVPAFREWARLMSGRSSHVSEDAMIAATARIHRLTVATRNVRDFQPFEVPVMNPFASINEGNGITNSNTHP